MYQSLLVPVDGSQHSRKALQVAARLIDGAQGRLHVINVREIGGDLLGRAAGTRMTLDDEGHAEGERLIDGCLNVIETGDAQVNRIVKAGAAADTIRDEAEAQGVDAIVIGSRGAGNLSRLVLGSVAYSVLHGAAGGVILVR
jgi:nucleotide-binding universal stress UspA family protein